MGLLSALTRSTLRMGAPLNCNFAEILEYTAAGDEIGGAQNDAAVHITTYISANFLRPKKWANSSTSIRLARSFCHNVLVTKIPLRT